MKTIQTKTGIFGKSAIGGIQVESHRYMNNDEIRIKGITVRGIVLKDELSIDKACAIEMANGILEMYQVPKREKPLRKIVGISAERQIVEEDGDETEEIEIWCEAKVCCGTRGVIQTIKSGGTILVREEADEAERLQTERNEMEELMKQLWVMGFVPSEVPELK